MIGDAAIARAPIRAPEKPDDFSGAVDEDRTRIAEMRKLRKTRERMDENLASVVQHVDDGAARQTRRCTALAHFGEADGLRHAGQRTDVDDVVDRGAVRDFLDDVGVELHRRAVDLRGLLRPQHGADLVERTAAATGDVTRLTDLDAHAGEAGRGAK